MGFMFGLTFLRKKSPVAAKRDLPLRQVLVRLLRCHGVNHVAVGDDAEEFETALSSLIEQRYADGEREAGAILRHPACQPA